jgi:hypothetical protein
MNEIRVLGKNSKHQGSRALKGIKRWRTKMTKCDPPLLQKKFSLRMVKVLGKIQTIKDLELWKGSRNKKIK